MKAGAKQGEMNAKQGKRRKQISAQQATVEGLEAELQHATTECDRLCFG
ncbi:MAG: hypothetical protein ACHBN1_10490 [Heteroscytonema crispum UTEX LB 1556]